MKCIYNRLTGVIVSYIEDSDVETLVTTDQDTIHVEFSAPLVPNIRVVAGERRHFPDEVDLGLALEGARIKRNFHLSQSDWTQTPDNSLSEDQKALWRAYRLALRDFTENWTLEKEWPKPPQ